MQGDTLAPFLFIIVFDYALRWALNGYEEQLGFTISPRRSKSQSAVTLTGLDFVDDIALLSDKIEQAQNILSRLQGECQNCPQCQETQIHNIQHRYRGVFSKTK